MRTLIKFTCVIAVAILAAAQAQATQLINETFSYADGDIVTGSGGVWSNHSGAGPVNIASGQAIVTQANGADVNRLIGGGGHSNDVLYACFDLTMTALPSTTGTYFIHFKNATTFFDPRVWAIGDGSGGFKLGIANASNGGAVGSPLWATSLSLSNTYHVVFNIDQTGVNMTSKLWVDPLTEVSTSIMSTDTVVSGTALVAIALRQATGEGTMAIDNLIVCNEFVDCIPEPSSIALVGIGLVGLWAVRRRRS